MVMDSRVGIDIKVKIDDGPVAIVDPKIGIGKLGMAHVPWPTIDTLITQMYEEHTKLQY